jgi:hypothetical protein
MSCRSLQGIWSGEATTSPRELVVGLHLDEGPNCRRQGQGPRAPEADSLLKSSVPIHRIAASRAALALSSARGPSRPCQRPNSTAGLIVTAAGRRSRPSGPATAPFQALGHRRGPSRLQALLDCQPIPGRPARTLPQLRSRSAQQIGRDVNSTPTRVPAFSGCAPARFGPGCGRGAGALGSECDRSRPARPGPHRGRRSARRRARPPAWPPAGSGPSSRPARHPAATGPWHRGRREAGALGDQRPGGHPDRGQLKDVPEVEGQAGAAGMVASGGIDHQHLGDDRQGAHGPLEQRPVPQRQQRWQRWPAGGSAAGHLGQEAATVSDGCPGEAPVTRTTRPLGLLEADEAGTDPRQGCRRLPACRGQLPEGVLQPGQLVGGGRPGRHGR